MFDELTKRGWMIAVIRTNSARTAMMPVSLTRKTRSVSRRELRSAGASGGSRRGASVVLTGAASRGCVSPGLLLELAGRRRHDLFLRRVRMGVLRDQPALAHDQDPVTHPQHLGQFRGDHQDRDTVPREL
jgi:hypothetical protein